MWKTPKKLGIVIERTMLALLFFPLHVYAQETSMAFSLKPYYAIVDTTEKDIYDRTVKVRWLNSTIEILAPASEQNQKAAKEKLKQLFEKKGMPFDSVGHEAMHQSFAQNCHSFALEQYFKSKKIEDGVLFTPSTRLFDKELEKILSESFTLIRKFTIKEFIKAQKELPQGILLVFRNQSNSPFHSVFYNNEFYSKNGAFGARVFPEVKPILKSYFDTAFIEAYAIDQTKFDYFKIIRP